MGPGGSESKRTGRRAGVSSALAGLLGLCELVGRPAATVRGPAKLGGRVWAGWLLGLA